MTLPIPPHELVRHLSHGKAQSVSKKQNDAVIIGADTVVVFNGEVYGKPKTKERAREFLCKFNGEMHSVITGYTIINAITGELISNSIETKVYFKKVSNEVIETYLKNDEALDKAGAYGFQGLGGQLFIKKTEGDTDNIIGLPVQNILGDLKKMGVIT